MTAADPRTVYLAEYQPYPYALDQVHLTFRLAPRATRVLARLSFAPNPVRPGSHDLRLDGEQLRLVSLRIGGREVPHALDAEGLTIAAAAIPVYLCISKKKQ